jgi:hypothetical protein
MIRYKKRCNWVGLGVAGVMLLATSGCNTMASSSVTVLDQGYVCGVNQTAGVELVSDAGLNLTDSSRIDLERSKKETDSSLDQERFWIVRVNMGQKPSGGYALRLISEQVEVSSDTARVSLQWLQPKPGTAQIQALTYPCLYLQVAKGNYTRLEIVDQEGAVRHDLNLVNPAIQ